MTGEEFDAWCGGLPAATRVVQWRGAHVWKVGGKMFAIGRQRDDAAFFAITFKVSEIAYEVLRQQPGIRPAPHLASRGLTWLQHSAEPGLSDAALREHLRDSHALVAGGLPKKTRVELGLCGGSPHRAPLSRRHRRRPSDRDVIQ